MRIGKSLTIVAAIACIFFSACEKSNSTPVTINNNGGNAPADPNQQKMLDLVNEARAQGCNCGNTYYPPAEAVTWNSLLAAAAKKHSEYMNSTQNLSHTGRNNTNPGTRISAEGYTWRTYGENIATGYPTEEAVIEGWLSSEGHCKNIMNPDFKEMGVATSGSYWTQVFATRQ